MKQISAKIIKDSYNPVFDSRITTFELEYPRFIHSELMTHRVFSRNAASSRAIPISSVIQMVLDSPATPVHWGKNQSGMQAKKELDEPLKEIAIDTWYAASRSAVVYAEKLANLGLHKQVVNRILEPFQWMKTVVTSTNWNNFFWLRYHEDADPTIFELAKVMKYCYDASKPVSTLEGDYWHIPYVHTEVTKSYEQLYFNEEGKIISLEEALKISASCCAQTSYRKLNANLEKAEDIFSKLIESEPVHASPVEHQALVIVDEFTNPLDYFCVKGVTHIDKNMVPWSNNFHGWIQYRSLIPNNVKPY